MQGGVPVAYASRSLTKSEHNYVLLELECLAIMFGTERFDQHIFGHHTVTIQTDNKLLVSIFKKFIHRTSWRLQAMLLHLKRYPNIKVTWRKDAEQITIELLSNDSYFDSTNYQQLPEHIFHIDFQNNDAPVCDDLINNIRATTAQDNELMTLTNLVKHDKNISNCTTNDRYKLSQDGLSIDNGIVYKGLRTIILKVLQRKVLQLLHTGHNGINSTLRRAHHMVFWLGLTNDIKAILLVAANVKRMLPNNRKKHFYTTQFPNNPVKK